MTMAFAPLASVELRRSLRAMLLRRLPAQDVDDVAQTILCDAMAASHIPAEPEELRRWLSGIARHKVVDFHRRAGRHRPTENVDGVSAAPSYEEREVLERLLAEPRTRRDAATFGWLVREHDGERLQDIATEENLPAPVVRQRVSRLRRALRSRWSSVLLLLLVVGASTARRSFSVTTITPEPASSATKSRPPTLLESAEGVWILESAAPRVVALVRGAVVRIDDGNVRIVGGAFERSWHVSRVDGTRVVLTDAGGRAETVDVTVARDRLEVHARGEIFVLRHASRGY